MSTHKFDCLFDALGGGSISSQIVANIAPTSKVYLYGSLAKQPLQVMPTALLSGAKIQGFMFLQSYWLVAPAEQKN